MKPLTRKELADIIGIHPKTLRRWNQKNGIDLPGGLISPANQIRILESLGYEQSSIQKKLGMNVPN